MKTKVLFFATFLTMLLIATNMNAQKKKASKKGIETAKTLHAEMTEMIESAKFKGKMYGQCSPMSYLKRLGKSGIIPPKKELSVKMDDISHLMTRLKPLKIAVADGYTPIHTFINTKSYAEFVKELYYSDLENFYPKELAQEVDTYYKQLQKLKKDGFVIDKRTVTKKECVFEIKTIFIMEKWEGAIAPDKKRKWITYVATLSGRLQTDIKINCNCKGKSTKALKNALFQYEMPTTLVIAFSKGSNIKKFVQAKKNESWLNLGKVNCCTDEDISYEDPSLEISPSENISLPNQALGLFGGIGFGQDFEETTICIGGEYLYNSTSLGNNPLFVGANAQLETTSFMDNSTTWVGFGPTVQLFTPLTPSNEVHLTNGLGANYIIGTNDNGVSKDDVSGFDVTFNTGLNIRLGNNLSAALVLPVLTYTNLTFEAEDGEASFEQQSTNLFIGKGNTAKLGLRFGF